MLKVAESATDLLAMVDSDHPLRRWRKAEKLTLEEFGERIGLPKATISSYEIGRRIPRPEHMALIRRATKGAVMPNDFYPQAAE